jgi:sugar transferase (PEP-CTERM/EpsH1 system associated)
VPPRLRVLLLTHRLPYAPNRGDRIRAFYMLRELAREHEVVLASLTHSADETSEVTRLAELAKETIVAPVPGMQNRLRALMALPSSRPLTHALLYSPALQPALTRLVSAHPPDVVIAYCSSMARVALDPPLDRFPLIIDMVDADSAKWQMLAAEARPPLNWIYRREARTLAAFEAVAMRRAVATVAVNDREVGHLKALAPEARIEPVKNGVDLQALAPSGAPAPSNRVVFCGVMNYAPNEAGAVWLAREVWPHVRRVQPSAELRIVGMLPTGRVRALADPSKGIVVTGSVPDVRPELWSSAVATAPLRLSRGVQTKVLDAVAAGLPCVITTEVANGLPSQIKPACPVADGAEEFAAHIVTCLHLAPPERRAMANVDLSELGWDRRLAPLLALVEEAARVKAR